MTDHAADDEPIQTPPNTAVRPVLVSSIAHLFDTHLAAISAAARGALEKLSATDPARADLATVERSTREATHLARQLLAFAQRLELQPRPVSLREWLATRETQLRERLGSAITLSIVSSETALAEVDPVQLDEMLWTLVDNAREAMPEGGTLAIEIADVTVEESKAGARALRAGDYVTLTLEDSGRGVDEAIRSHVFDPFFTTKAHERHRGLGLAAVRGVARQSGGDVVLRSSPRGGTAVRIALPRTTVHTSTVPPPDGSTTILLVEDQPQVRVLASRVLKRGGYRVLEAADGEEALRISAAHVGTIDLLLTDVVMPGLNGKEVAARITAERPDTPVLYMSGYTDRIFGANGILDANVGFLQKPFTPTVLLAKVRRLVAGAAERSEDSSPPVAARRRILVVEDEPLLVQLFARTLERHYDVTTVSDGREALARIDATFDLVLLDVDLPGVSGIEVFASLQEKTPELTPRVVFLTGGATNEAARVFLESNGNPCLQKPLLPSTLAAFVRERLEPSG